MPRILTSLILVATTVMTVGVVAGAAEPSRRATPAYEPTYDPAPCDDVLPADPRIECGVLTVPVDRAHPRRGDVTLPVAVIRSAAPDPLPDPIIYFSGGPGGVGRTAARSFLEQDLGGRRDVIVFDQRGTGKATPSLDCPAQVELVWEILGAPTPPREEAERFREVLADCRADLVAEGVDLDAYDTSTTADDVADLRRALGVEEWNLFGVSYGTTVALEMLRRHPEGVRSAVIDSVYPPDTPSGPDQQARVGERALRILFRGCQKDPVCRAAYPDLEAEFDALVEEWNEQPFEVDVEDPATGAPRSLVITGNDVVAGLWNAMYEPDLIPILPSLVTPLRERTDLARTVVQQLATEGIDALAGAAEAVFAGVDCADRQRIAGPDLEAVLDDHPRMAGLVALATTGNACDVIDVRSVPAAFNRPVRSRVPVLVFADDYDPITPPGQSRHAARTLPRATVVSTHGLGHGVARTNDCTRGIFAAFVDDPTAKVDASCTEEMSGPTWVTG